MTVNIHQFIRYAIRQSVLLAHERAPRKQTSLLHASHDHSASLSASHLKTPKPRDRIIGNEPRILDLQTHTGIERLESYASLKRKNKEKSKLLRILGALLVVNLVFSILLFFYNVHLRDLILWHNVDVHKIEGDDL